MGHDKDDDVVTALTRATTSQAFSKTVLDLVKRWSAASCPIENADSIVQSVNRQLIHISQQEQKLVAPPALPRLLQILDRRLPDETLFKNALDGMHVEYHGRSLSPEASLDFYFSDLLLRSVLDGLDKAFAKFVHHLMTVPSGPLSASNVQRLGLFFIVNHWLDGPLTETAEAIKNAAKANSDPETVLKLLALSGIVGFSVSAPRHWLDFLFKSLVFPAATAAVEARMHETALKFERTAYANYTQAKDDAEHFRETVHHWIPLMRRCGKDFGGNLPTPPAPEHGRETPKVAFYLHNSEILGHTEAFLSFLRGLAKLAPKPIDAIVYISGEINPALDRYLTEYGVEGVYLRPLAGEPVQVAMEMSALRQDIRKRGVTAVVFVSLALYMPFAFSMRLAPVQIWWSMKYHSLEMPEIDGYMALGSFDRYRTIDGRPWRAVHRAMEPLFDPNLTAEAGRIRERLLADQGTLLLGCIGRAEKMVGNDYIAAVADVMNAVPKTVFMWTGKSKNPRVVRLLEKFGINERCRYVGWIDTRLYAQVLDIFLDTFPFASGLTAFEAMAAERPVVSMITREALGTGMPAHVWPVYRGEVGTPEIQQEVRGLFTDVDGGSLLPFAESVDAYRSFSIRLCEDEGYRSRAGAAARRFVERYMTNDERMAETGCRHILEIIDESLGG